VFCCHCAECDPHDGVSAGGVDPQLFCFAVQLIGEGEAHAVALANPVALHGAYLVWPAFHLIHFIQQFFGIVGDLDEPLRDFVLFHQGARTPAATVYYLFIGQYGLVHRIPVHYRILFVHQPLAEQFSEQPLFPLVILWLAGCQFPVPVVAESKLLQLALHVLNIGVGPLGRWHLIFYGSTFCRQSEGIPAHGLEYVFPLHALVA